MKSPVVQHTGPSEGCFFFLFFSFCFFFFCFFVFCWGFLLLLFLLFFCFFVCLFVCLFSWGGGARFQCAQWVDKIKKVGSFGI